MRTSTHANTRRERRALSHQHVHEHTYIHTYTCTRTYAVHYVFNGISAALTDSITDDQQQETTTKRHSKFRQQGVSSSRPTTPTAPPAAVAAQERTEQLTRHVGTNSTDDLCWESPLSFIFLGAEFGFALPTLGQQNGPVSKWWTHQNVWFSFWFPQATQPPFWEGTPTTSR